MVRKEGSGLEIQSKTVHKMLLLQTSSFSRIPQYTPDVTLDPPHPVPQLQQGPFNRPRQNMEEEQWDEPPSKCNVA